MEKPDYRKEKFNIASYLPYMAEIIPYKRAVIFPESRDKAGRVAYTHLTFAALNEECDRYADGLSKYGIGRGVKTLLMLRPGLEFIALAFALFKTGAVPILIDPGMGIFNMLKCVAKVSPEAVVAVPEVHAVKSILSWYFRSVKYNVVAGKNWLWRALTLDKIKSCGRAPFKCVETSSTDPAAILFTSGSTGPAKGVLYEHGMFGAQVELLKTAYNFGDNEIELPGFPLFALFNVALGMSCVIPDMDPTRPSQVDPVKITEGIINQGVTNTFGSPAIWNRVADYCNARDIKLNSIKRILIAGAPVSGELIGRVKKMLSAEADVHTPYGATESLPLCNICGSDILAKGWEKTKKGAGILVGKPVSPNEIKIIKIISGPIENLDSSILAGAGEIGEIIARGPIVTKEYYADAKATALAKIKDGGDLWHRMGDAGYIDETGNLWFCGRKDHRVISGGKVYYSVKTEAIFNNHPAVYRSALAADGERPNQTPVIFIESMPGMFPEDEAARHKFRLELMELSKQSELTSDIKMDKIYFIEKMPVDVRHNAKIFREKLSEMVSRGNL